MISYSEYINETKEEDIQIIRNAFNRGKKFIVGEYYIAENIRMKGDPFKYKVIKRTNNTITIENEFGEISTRKIISELTKSYRCEVIYPEGKYSMAPILKAKDIIEK